MQKQVIRKCPQRRGAVLVETAVIMPVFLIIVFAIFEFGHAYLATNVLNAAAGRSARRGAVEHATNSDVLAIANQIIESGISSDSVTVTIKDASIFDDGDATDVDISSLPDLNLAECEPRQLFIVQVKVPYEDIGIMGPRWLNGVTLHGEAVMRHE